MKTTTIFLVLFCILAALVSTPSFSSEHSKRERILYYFEVNGVLKSLEHHVDAMRVQAKKEYSHFPKELWANGELDKLFEKYKTDLFEAYIKVANDNLTSEELDWLIEFLDTEQGRKMFKLNSRVRPLYDQAASEVYPQFMKNINALLIKYAP